MSNNTLYNIKQEYIELQRQAEEAEGVLTPELEQAMKITDDDKVAKSMSWLSVIRSKEALITQGQSEIKRIQQIIKVLKNSVDYLEGNLLDGVNTFGEYGTEFTRFSTRKSTRVEVENVNALDPIYKTTKITETPDKVAIKKGIEAGQEIKGATIIEVKHLKIN